MKEVSVEELVNQRILPFDLYNANQEKIFSAGEVLTPGKLLQLRYVSAIYREDDEITEIQDTEEPKKAKEQDKGDGKTNPKDIAQRLLKHQPSQSPSPVIETKTPLIKPEDQDYVFENEVNYISVRAQKNIRSLFRKAMNATIEGNIVNNTGLYIATKDKIIEEVLPIIDDIVYRSQLKINGDYNYAHGINVAVLSAILAIKLKLNENLISDITLGAMLHDIGKTKIPEQLILRNTLTAKETKLLQLHPQIGYKIIKNEMKLPEQIAKIALEHHERNDGSGYPYGISGDLISLPSQVVIICDVYDALTSNRGHIKVKNAKEAIKVMLDIGSKWFMPSVLYTFIHMSNYNDTKPLI